jgi:hypothetical protein
MDSEEVIMKIYAIWNKSLQSYVRFGINGGGFLGFTQYRGVKIFYEKKENAQKRINSFDNPSDYEIHEFTRAE